MKSEADKDKDALYILRRKQIIPMVAGKFDTDKIQITPEMYREMVNNPQGKIGRYRRYIPGSPVGKYGDDFRISDRLVNEYTGSSYPSPDQRVSHDYNNTAWIPHPFGEATAGACRRNSARIPGRPCCRSATILPTTTASSPAMPA